LVLGHTCGLEECFLADAATAGIGKPTYLCENLIFGHEEAV
jgi:hypothetical protein